MRKIYLVIAITLFVARTNMMYALTGGSTITVPSVGFPTIASVIADYNTNGITGTGNVTVNCTRGTATEVGTSATTFHLSNVATNPTTASKQLIFQSSGTGANYKLRGFDMASAAAVSDAIVKIIGVDYVTFDAIDIEENPSNTTAGATNDMFEVGYGLFYSSVTNGAQFNIIKNCTITLNRTYTTTIGVFSTVRATNTSLTTAADITNFTGSNSGNLFTGNNISNVNMGIAIVGSATASQQDTGWIVTNNTITNYGTGAPVSTFVNLSGTVNGIVINNIKGYNISGNTITSSSAAVTASALHGIFMNNSNQPTGTVIQQCNSNIITITSGSTSSNCIGINSTMGNATTTQYINNNKIDARYNVATTTSGNLRGILHNVSVDKMYINTDTVSLAFDGAATMNSGPAAFILSDAGANVRETNNNILQSVSNHLRTTGSTYGISHSGTYATSLDVNNNTITYTRTGTTGSIWGMYNNGSTANTVTSYKTNNNSIRIGGIGASTAVAIGIQNTDGGQPSKEIKNNTIDISGTHTGASTGIQLNYGIPNASNNNIRLSSAGSITGIDFTSTSLNTGYAFNDTIKIYSSLVSPTLYGINTSATTLTNRVVISNNIIDTISASASSTSAPTIAGIRVSIGTNDTVSGNVIRNISTGTGTGTASISGILFTGSTTPSIFNNNISNISTQNSGTSSLMSGINFQGGSTTFSIYNNIISGLEMPNASRTAGLLGINCASTICIYKTYYNTIRLSPTRGTATNFGAIGIGFLGSTSSTQMDARNNIVWINVTPNGTAFSGCMVSTNTPTAGLVPPSFATTSNNNIYYINSNKYNFLFAQGTDTTNMRNCYATSGLTVDITKRVFNDVSFNTSCGLYKKFISSSGANTCENSTFNENNLASLGTTPPTFAPSGTSYAENSAQSGLTPNITTDYSNVNRTPTNDRGALQFSGNNIDASAPTISYTNLKNPVCTNNQVLTAVIKDANGMVATGAGVRPRMFYKRNLNTDSFNVAFNNNTFNGWKYVEGVQMNASDTLWQFTMDYSLLDGGAVAVGDSFKYFVVAQDTATPAVNVGTNTISFPSIYCPSSVAIDNFATIPSSAIGTSGAKQDTIKALPNPITISATNTAICISGSTLLTSSLFTAGLKVDSTYWEESTDSITFSTISSSNKDTITQNLSGSTKYFRQVVMCGSSPVDTSDAIKIKVNNPQVLSVKGDTICGSDTAHLSATVSSGDTAIWYKTPTSQIRLKVGNTLDTFLSANDTFYVAANTNPALTALTTFGAGGGTSNASGSPFYYSWGGSKTQYIILASELASAGFSAGTISSLALNISSIGNMNANDTLYISMGSTSQTTATSTHVSGTTLVYFSATGLNITSTGWNTFNFSTPYNWNGTSNLVVQFAWSRKNSGSAPGATVVTNNTGATLNTYSYADGVAASAIFNTLTGATGGSGGTSTTTIRPQFKFGVQVGGCQSARTQVIVIRNTPPTIAVTAPTFICTGQSAALNVTSTNDPNYNYTWNPGALIGAAQSVSPVATTTYTVNAIDTTTGCATSKDTIVQVRPYPTKPILNVDSVYVCSNAIQTLTVTNPFLVPNTSTTSSAPLSLLFPDNSSAGTSTTLSVAGIPSNAIIDSMAVMVTIKTTFVADVELNLQAPNGQIVNLIADNGGLDDNFTNTRISSNNSNPALPTASGSGQAPFSNTYRATATANTNLIAALSLPTTALMSNLWTTPNGTWTLRCYDDASGDFDTLKSWTIQIYYRSPCNYSWTPAANLYTDAPATINYTSGDSLTLYAKNTSNTNYIATATLNGCSTSDTAKYTLKNSSQSVVLAGGPLSGVTLAVDCEEGNWTYYADPMNSNTWVIAIDWNGTNNAAAKASASVSLQVGSMYQDTAIRSSGYSDGAFIMGRYWNVALSGGNTINPAFPVKVRFYYDQSDLNAVETARDNAISNWNGGNPTRLAYPTPIRWFKTVGTAFDPAILASDGNKFTDTTVTLDTGATGFHNGVQYIEHHNITSFSGGGVGFGMSQYPSNTLPVTLINFGGNVAQDHNHIKWVTASEINNDRFELQSSHNGREFNTIATISGHGNSTEINEYSFNDYQYHSPTSYYRLNQIDFDGSATLSNIISLTRSAIGTSTVVSMYPNPTQHNVTLSVQVGNAADATITVYDASGKVVLTNTMVCNKGNNSTQLDISSLADGVYIVDVLVQGEHIKSRLVKTH